MSKKTHCLPKQRFNHPIRAAIIAALLFTQFIHSSLQPTFSQARRLAFRGFSLGFSLPNEQKSHHSPTDLLRYLTVLQYHKQLDNQVIHLFYNQSLFA